MPPAVGTVTRPERAQGKDGVHPHCGAGRGTQSHIPALRGTLIQLPPSWRTSTSDTRFVPTCLWCRWRGRRMPLHGREPSRALRWPNSPGPPDPSGYSGADSREAAGLGLLPAPGSGDSPGTILGRSRASAAGVVGCAGTWDSFAWPNCLQGSKRRENQRGFPSYGTAILGESRVFWESTWQCHWDARMCHQSPALRAAGLRAGMSSPLGGFGEVFPAQAGC